MRLEFRSFRTAACATQVMGGRVAHRLVASVDGSRAHPTSTTHTPAGVKAV